MNQAQSSARKRLDEIFAGPYEHLGSQAIISEAQKLKRRGRNKDYTFTMEEQIRIEVWYEVVFDPAALSLQRLSKDRRRVK